MIVGWSFNNSINTDDSDVAFTRIFLFFFYTNLLSAYCTYKLIEMNFYDKGFFHYGKYINKNAGVGCIFHKIKRAL